MVWRVFGIANCSTVKKARDWLDQHDCDYRFHDFKKLGVTPEMLQGWLQDVPLEVLLNRRGTTWRALDDAARASAESQAGAIALMVERPSLIKRPVVVDARAHVIGVGFTADTIQVLEAARGLPAVDRHAPPSA